MVIGHSLGTSAYTCLGLGGLLDVTSRLHVLLIGLPEVEIWAVLHDKWSP